MKVCIAILIALSALCAIQATPIDQGQEIILNSQDKAALYQAYDELEDEIATLLLEGGIDSALNELKSGNITLGNPVNAIFALAKKQLNSSIALILTILAIAIISAITTHISFSFSKGASEIASFICFALGVGVAVSSFSAVTALASKTITLCAKTTQIAFPILMLLMTATGQAASAGLFQSATAVLTTLITTLMQGLLLPIALAMGGCAVIANVSKNMPVKNILKLLKSAAKWLLGLVSTVYIGALSLKAIAVRGVDGVSLRAARFTLDRMIPYAGSIMSGSVDSVLGINLLLKNSFGIVLVILLCGLMLTPLIKIAVTQLTFRLLAAVIEPIGDSKLSGVVTDLADVLGIVFAISSVSLLMMILTVGMILCSAQAIL